MNAKHIEALKLTLEALESLRGFHICSGISCDGVITALREALAEQPEQQEPFGFMTAKSGWGSAQTEMVMKITRKAQPEYGLIKPLYTSPQPAQRKPLTDEQIGRIYETPEIAGSCFENATDKAIALARAIESAHGIYAPSELKENE